MRVIVYLVMALVFWFFFSLFELPLLLLIPAAHGDGQLSKVLGVVVVILFIAWHFVCAPWLAHCAAKQSAYESASFSEAVRWAVNEGRLRLAYLPVVGSYFTPPLADSNGPKEPE